MAWERKIPFGYMMQNGNIIPHPTESKAVKAIFAMYCHGTSYNGITAEMMAQGIPYYQKTNRWNKNMVSRVLENERYIGADNYPRLVTDSDFLSVRLLRQTKTSYTPCPPEVRSIRERTVCAACGGRMKRDTKNRRPRWRCQEPNCGLIIHIKDDDLLRGIQTQAEKLADTPHLLKTSPPEKSLSIDAVRIQNELNLCLNRAGTSPEYLKSLIFAAAEERYNSTPDPTPAYENERLRERLQQQPCAKETLTELFQKYVSAVLIGTGGHIALRLRDGTVFDPKEGE